MSEEYPNKIVFRKNLGRILELTFGDILTEHQDFVIETSGDFITIKCKKPLSTTNKTKLETVMKTIGYSEEPK